jgi:hypothetical protein
VQLHAYAVDDDFMQPPCAARRHGGGNGDAGADEGNGLARLRQFGCGNIATSYRSCGARESDRT